MILVILVNTSNITSNISKSTSKTDQNEPPLRLIGGAMGAMGSGANNLSIPCPSGCHGSHGPKVCRAQPYLLAKGHQGSWQPPAGGYSLGEARMGGKYFPLFPR